MVKLETVEIPGLREAVQRESHVRDTAFLEGKELVCGVLVRPLCLESLIWLEQAKNGFFVRCVFFDESEKMAHALQVLFYSRPDYRAPESPVVGFWRSFHDGLKEQLFIRRVVKSMPRHRLFHELEAWISDAFMDAPAGGGGSVRPRSYASYPAYIVDRFGEAGYTFTYQEIMQMPLKRLWQFLRVANRRLKDETLTNPSDQIAADFVARK